MCCAARDRPFVAVRPRTSSAGALQAVFSELAGLSSNCNFPSSEIAVPNGCSGSLCNAVGDHPVVAVGRRTSSEGALQAVLFATLAGLSSSCNFSLLGIVASCGRIGSVCCHAVCCLVASWTLFCPWLRPVASRSCVATVAVGSCRAVFLPVLACARTTTQAPPEVSTSAAACAWTPAPPEARTSSTTCVS